MFLVRVWRYPMVLRFTQRSLHLIILFIGFLLALSLACSLTPSVKPMPTSFLIPTDLSLPSSLPPSPTVPPQPLPPTLVESKPPTGSEIPLAGPITLYFSQSMHHPSVESALSGQPTLSGRFTWTDDSTVTFT